MKSLFVLFCLLSLPALAPAQANFSSIKASFESQRDKIFKARDIDATLAGETYLKHLTSMAANFQKAGNLDPTLAVKKEADRWQDELSIEEKHISRDIPVLRSLQEQFQTRLLAIDRKHAQTFLKLASAYNERLKVLQTDLTKAGKLAEATKVRDEITALPKSEGVVVSRRVIQQATAAGAASAAAAAPIKAPAAPAAGGKASVARNFKGSDKYRISKRFEETWNLLLNGKVDDAIKYLEPDKVEEAGVAAIRPFMQIFAKAVQGVNAFGAKPKGGRIEYLNEAKTQARFIPSMKSAFGEKDADDPVDWILIRGDWYMVMK